MYTPYYIFHKKKFIELLTQYKKYADVYYPIKANDNSSVIKAVISNGGAFEVDSIQHIRKLVINNAVNPRNIIFSFPIKKETDIIFASELGVTKYVIDSIEEYFKINKYVKNAEYIVRLNANSVVGGMNAFQDKWGFSPADIDSAIGLIKEGNGNLYGISFYLSSEINNLENFRKVFTYLKTINLSCFYMVDIGGGVKIETLSQLKNDINDIKQLTNGKKLIVEPGKDLLDPCFQMKVSIIACKKSVDGKRILFIDAGIYHGLLDVVVKNKRFDIYDLKNDGVEDYYICGCSSDVSDFIGCYTLSRSLEVGDSLIINGCGAYSAVMTTNFYSKKKPRLQIKE